MTHHDIFDSLTRNAFDFLERGIAEFDKSPKYSVIHFCAAVEMLLKARLMKEHWSLIVSKPDQANLAKFMAGDFTSVMPVILGGSLVIPAGLLLQRKGQPGWTADVVARARVEQIAMRAVMDAERALGFEVIDLDGAVPPRATA